MFLSHWLEGIRRRPRFSARVRKPRRGDAFPLPTSAHVETLEKRVLLTILPAALSFDPAPVIFESNQGQADASVVYASRGANLELSLLRGGAVFEIGPSASAPASATGAPGRLPAASPAQVSMTWQGGNESPSVVGLGELAGAASYVVGNDSSGWQSGVSRFERVHYGEVYNGIDLEFYGRGREIEFDWIVAPGADPSQITMAYAGMDDLSLDAGRNLVISAGNQQFVQHAPVVYQVIAGEQRAVAGSYRLDEGGAVRFELGEYDSSVTLVIDPVVSYSTYLGGSKNDYARDIAADSAGNTYVIGTTRSANLPGFVSQDTGNERAFLAKYSPAGIIDAEFTNTLGPPPRFDAFGYAESFGYQVVVGPDDLPLVSFESVEVGTADVGAPLGLLPLPGPHSLHIQKLDASGLMVFDTIAPLLDTPGYHDPIGFFGVHMATDDVGAVYVTYAAVRLTGGGPVPDAFFSKLAPNGSVEFTRHLGGYASAVAVDSDYNIYVALTTSRDDLPVTPNAFQPKKSGASDGSQNLTTDVWLGVVDPTGSNLLVGTYIGGSGNDSVGALALDPDHLRVYLVGTTELGEFPGTETSFQPQPTLEEPIRTESYRNGYVAYIDLKVTPEQPTQRLVATYFGGGRGDYLSDIAMDAAGNVYVVGATNSRNLPVVNPFQSTLTQGPVFSDSGFVIYAHDLVVAKFDNNLASLAFSTYLGGKGHDSGASLAVDANGTIHVAATSAGGVKQIDGPVIPTADFPLLGTAQRPFGGGEAGRVLQTDAVVLSIVERSELAGRGAQAIQARPFNGIVADFISPRPNASASEFRARIEWEDGVTTDGIVTASTTKDLFRVLGTYEFEKVGAYPVSVSVTDTAGEAIARNINVSRAAGNQTGGSIAIDPTNPRRLAAVMTDETGETRAKADGIGGGGGILLATSKDGGLSWSPRLIGTGTDGLPPALGEPDITFDLHGNLHVAYVGADGNNIVVASSTDGGATFLASHVHQLTVPGSTPSGPNAPTVRGPKLVATRDNELWIAFGERSIMVAGTRVESVSGMNFQPLQEIPGSVGGEFSDLVIGPKGEIVVVWQADVDGFKGLLGSVDSFGLLPGNFSPSFVFLKSNSVGLNAVAAQPRRAVPLGPRLAAEPTEGQHGGRIFLTYSDREYANDTALSVYLIYSDDGGFEWSYPTKVSNHQSTTTQFSPGIAIDPTTGNLAVTWYEAVGELTAHLVATSADRGETFSQAVRVSEGFSDAVTDPKLTEFGRERAYGPSPRPAFFAGKLYPIWSDNNKELSDGNVYAPQFDVVTKIVGVIEVSSHVFIYPRPIEAVMGQPFDKTVALFFHPGLLTPNDFEATIVWGDDPAAPESPGLISQPGGPSTPFVITGSHTYAQAGGYPVLVRVRDKRTDQWTQAVGAVSSQQGSETDPTIAVDPTDSRRAFAAWVGLAGLLPQGIPVATSDDGGATWTARTIADGNDNLPPGAVGARAVFDQFGNLFVTYLTPSPDKQVVVLLSTDGGQSFATLRTFSGVQANQPSIAVGPGAGGKDASVWLTWEQDEGSAKTIRTAGAPVNGLGLVESFAERLVAPLVPDGLSRNFGDIALGPDGQVLVTYLKEVSGSTAEGPAQIIIHLDPDGLGLQPFAQVKIVDTGVGPQATIPAQPTQGIDAEGNLAWDRSSGTRRGWAYLVYTDVDAVGASNTDLFLRRSEDAGVTWSDAIPIASGPESVFLPSIAVDQSSGNLAIAWYESPATKAELLVRMSDDGGVTWRPAYRASAGESDATDPSITDLGRKLQFGHYTGLAFVDGILYPISTDNSVELAGNPDPPNLDIASARVAVAQVSRALLVVQSVDVNEVEGFEFTAGLATFSDPGGPGVASAYSAKINWGDGSAESTDPVIRREPDGSFTVLGAHEYKAFGHYTASVSIKGPQTHGAADVAAVIANAPRFVSFGQGHEDLRVVRDTDFTKVIATLTDLNHNSKATDFDVTIDWGDGPSDGVLMLTQAGGPGEANRYSITGKHRYNSEDTFAVTVTVREKASGERVEGAGSIVSGDPPLEVKPGDFLDIEALEGINTGDLVLAKFTVPEDIGVQIQSSLGEYTATINWGDGQVDIDIVPFVTSEDVTVVGRHTYFTAGQYYPSVTLQDDSGGFFSAPLIATVEPDVTSQIHAIGSGLIPNPVTGQFVGELNITNVSTTSISGPLFVVIHGLPAGVTLDSFTAIDGEGRPLYKVNQSVLAAGASLPPIALAFSNPSRVPIHYTVQVFDGIRPQLLSGAGLVFEPNLGQANDSVSYLALGASYAIGLAGDHAALVLRGDGGSAGAAAFMEWVGGNGSPAAAPLDPLPGVSNYLYGDSSIAAVPHYGRVRYASVYDGVDLEYYGREGVLEYDWIVRPGADVSDIAMRFGGVDGMLMDSAGNLRLQTPGGELVQRAPVAYQLIDGQRHEVTASFVPQADGTVTFAVGDYDPSAPLVIDPVLVYSTYFGGSFPNFGDTPRAVAVDSEGNSYITGRTISPDFPTVNPIDDDLNDQSTFQPFLDFDAFVTKLDPSGVPVFSTFLGGSLGALGVGTQGGAIAVDGAGRIWVGGQTNSPSFPAPNPAPVTLPTDPIQEFGAFLTQLTPDGSAIVYSTILPGNNRINDIALDSDGTIYAVGNTDSQRIFALKFDSTGAEASWARYVSGVGTGMGRGIAVDDLGQIYLGGSTNSPYFPIRNALFPELLTPEFDPPRYRAYTGFVMKLSNAGDLLFSTYLGGSNADDITDIAVDGAGVIHVVGYTTSTDLPAPGGLDTTLTGFGDGFLIKLANDGSAVLYGAYVGGSGSDEVNGVAVDAQGRTYLAGSTHSTDLPTVRAHQSNIAGSFRQVDGFAASIAADGGSFIYLTYWGGSGFDELVGVAADAAGNATYVGSTNSPDLPTRNPWQQRLGGGIGYGLDVFVVRLLAGDAGTITLHNAPFTAVEGRHYNGLVAFFETNGTETADQFTAVIDWGDGLTSAGAISGDYLNGFQVFGNHLYPDVGAHDIFVTLRDSLGRPVTVTDTGAGVAGREARAHYRVAIDTAALAGTQGLLSFQFNPGAIPGGPDAEARITGLSLFGGDAGAGAIDGDVTQASSSELALRPSAALNRIVESVTLGTRIEFNLDFVGAGLTQPGFGDFADVFAVQLLSANGVVPLLSADATKSVLRVSLSPDGSTHAQSADAAATVAASGRATVANGPVNLDVVPFTIQEGLAFNSPVATFTNGNPFELAAEFTATFDWGDGSPIESGVVSGGNGQFTISGAHVYEKLGSYPLAVTVTDPDGLEVRSATGKSILAALGFHNNWSASGVPPVTGDFNGDGILDVAVGPFLAAPTPTFETGVGILLGHGDGSFEVAGFQITGQFGWNVTQLVAADFNNDGKLDVAAAVAKFGAPTVVELLLGNGDGTLQPKIRLTELTNPGNIGAADFNRDGNVDLIYTESTSNTPRVALGRGNGTFEAPASAAAVGGLGYVADMDGDAVPDIIRASSNFGVTTLDFLRGVGDGTFDTPITFASGLAFGSLAIDDFDGDGHRDVAVAVGTNLNCYSGNGNGTFDAPVQIATGSSGALVAADFNSDGQVDLAMTGLNSIRVFLNDGVDGFANGVPFDGVSNLAGLLADDFDGDGHIDLATFGFTSVISVIPGIGDGTFASAVRYATGFSSPFSPDQEGVSTADVNGDTHTDAVMIMRDGPIVTQLGNGDGTFQSVVSGNLGFGSFRSPVLADVNNDGRLDVLASQGSGISVVLGSGDGAFPTSDLTNPGSVRETVLADFNQDGRLDVAGVSFNQFAQLNQVSISLANADGTLQNRVFYTSGAGRMMVGDFNGDSRLDIARVTLGGISVLLGNADGTFAAAINTVVGTPPFDSNNSPESAKAGDFNGDGKLDIVQVGFFGAGLVLPGNGDGTFGAALTFTNNVTSRDVAVGDFNADGKLDIVTAEESGEHFSAREGFGGVSVLFGNGNGTFQTPVDYFAGSLPRSVTLGDFNQDGRLDIAAANFNGDNATSGSVSILIGNANGTFQAALNYTITGSHPRAIAVGDLNADGKPDLAVVNQSRDTAILLGNGNGTFQPSLNYATRGDGLLGGPIAVAIGDVNGDGRADLVAGDSLLFGNGDGTFSNRLFTYLPPVINVTFQSSEPQDVAAGDLNADGNLDIAVSMRGTTVILFGNGNGSFLPPRRLDPPVAAGIGGQSNRVGVVDMDGDGDLDVVTLHANLTQPGGAVAVWRNNGAGVFSVLPVLVRNVPFPTYDDNLVSGSDLELSDLNGDDFVDVVVTDNGTNDTDINSSGGVSVMLGVGDGSLSQPVRYLVAPRQGASRVALADVNRDGRPEIIAMSAPIGFGASRSAVALFMNNGDGSFGPARIYDHGAVDAWSLAAGDFNGDAKADIFVPATTGASFTFSIIYAGDGPILVTDAPVTVTAADLNPRAGAAFTATVATFTDENPFDVAGGFTATIDWGDGETSAGSVRDYPLGGFEVTGSHAYATAGEYTTTVTVHETGQGTHRGSATARVSATDQALTAAGLEFNALEDLPFTGAVATFTDADPNASLGDFSAVIDWGDGQTSAGAIALLAGGGFAVIGTHSYANPGALPVQVDIADIGGSSATANSTAQVAPRVNQAPLAADDAYSTNEDATLAAPTVQGVLANDADADADALGALLVTGPAHGSLTFNPDGSFSYTPAANFNGADSFAYQANDGSADSNVAVVNITVKSVNDPPVANDDSTSTREDTPVVIDVLANDANRDGAINPATLAFTSQPIHGTVRADAATGAITYTPAGDFFGSDSLRYKVRDGNGLLSNEAVVSITVHAVNDAPAAGNDHYATSEDAPLIIAAAQGVLANDTDAEASPLSAAIFAAPAHGTVTLNGDGSFSYVPAADFSGSDSFSYRASDGIGESVPATVSLIILPVNDAPVVSSLADRVIDEGGPLTGSGSFIDPEPDDSWTATVDYGDGAGVQPLSFVGAAVALEHNYLDSGQFVTNVKILDQSGGIGSANFKVTVQNLAATVQAGADQVSSEGGLVGVLGSFADPGRLDTHTATIDWGDGTATQPVQVNEASGAGSIFASHAYADENAYLVTVTVTDDEGASASDTLTVTVGNVAPRVEAGPDRAISAGEILALPDLFTVGTFDEAFSVRTFQMLAASFIDSGALDSHTAIIDWGDGTVEAAPLEERPLGPPAGVSGAVRGAHVYASPGNFRVQIAVTDNDGGVGSGSFNVAVNQAGPTLTLVHNTGLAVAEGSSATLSGGMLQTSHSDPSVAAADIVYTLSAEPSQGSLTRSGQELAAGGTFTQDDVNNGRLAYMANEEGADSFGFNVTAGAAASVSGTFLIAASDPAIIPTGGFTVTASEGSNSSAQTVATFTDPAGFEPLANYSAEIDWGDGGSATAGAISFDGNTHIFTVSGQHMYSHGGTYTIQATLRHENSPAVAVDSTAQVADAPIAGGGGIAAAGVAVTGNERDELAGVTVATFTGGDGSAPASDFSAAIDWGDGATSAGSVTLSAGAYAVTGSHEYLHEGYYTIRVDISQAAGAATGGATSAAVSATATIHEELLAERTIGAPYQNYIQDIYRHLFGRHAEPQGREFWVNRLTQGTPRGQVAYEMVQLATPREFQRDAVATLFAQYLGRAPDPAGDRFWTAYLYDRGTIEGMSQALVNSQEYFQSRAGGTTAGFLTALFHDALGRPIDSGALTYFEGRMAKGMTAAEVAALIFASDEYHRMRVDALFKQFMGRAADSGALAYFAGEFDNGASEESIVAQLISSDEFFKHAQI